MAIEKHLDGVNVWTDGSVNVRLEVLHHREDPAQSPVFVGKTERAVLWEVEESGADGALKTLSGLYDSLGAELTLADLIRHIRDNHILPGV